MRALLIVTGALLAGCEFEIPSGRFACATTSECPPGQQCVDGLCIVAGLDAGRDGGTPPVDGGDAGVDADSDSGAPADAGDLDAGDLDAGDLDGGAFDGGVDAGGCALGEIDCGAGCTDTDEDPLHCGACGDPCGAVTNGAATCSAGVCGFTCDLGFHACGAGCASDTSTMTCGTSCTACTAPANGAPTCIGTACDFACDTGFHRCGDACASNTSTMTCGTSCTACPVPANATTATCDGAACGFSCATGFGNCDGGAANGCETDTRITLAHCGACGSACPPVANGSVTCAASACGFTCDAGFLPVGSMCAPIPPPRPIAPLSLGDVTLRRPTLRWALPTGVDGAVVELCRDRGCAMLIETLRVTGTSVRPSADLPARTVVYWRMRGRAGTNEGTGASPTWLFHVPGRSASSGIDTSFNPHLDLNADGFDDVAIGAAQASPGGRAMAGTVSVYLGASTGIPSLPTGVLEGVAAMDQFGTSAASAGDVDGDGYADLAIGAYSSSPSGRSGAGTVSLFRGGPTGVSAIASQVLAGAAADDHFGISAESGGDVDGDGYADLVVGALDADPGGRAAAGTAMIFHGSATGLTATPRRTLEGVAAGDRLGSSVAGIGDVNGDGLGDIAVTAISADPGGRTDAGTVSVYHGGSGGIGASAARVLEGVGAGDRFGRSVSLAGDVNADGFADLIVGAFAADAGPVDSGTAGVYHGSVTGIPVAPARLLVGFVVSEFFGYAVAGAGDVNADGFDDVIIGAINSSPGGRMYAGTARIYHGSASGIPAAAARTLEGVAAGDELGSSVAGARDVNADGFSDVLAGTILASPGARTRAGSASVFHGSASGIPMSPARVLEGASAGDYFSGSIARSDAGRWSPGPAWTRRREEREG